MALKNEMLVLWDSEGACYMLSAEALEQARISADQAGELFGRLSQEDVSGYLTPIPIPNALEGGGGVGAGGKTAVTSPFAAGGSPIAAGGREIRSVQGLVFSP